MYNKDLTRSFTIRLTDADMQYCEEEASRLDMTVSRFIRLIIEDCRIFAETQRKINYDTME